MSTFLRSAISVMDMKDEDKQMYELAVESDEQTEAPPSSSCEYDDSDYCESEEEEDPYVTDLQITYEQYKNLVEYYISQIFNLLDENNDGKLSKGENIPSQCVVIRSDSFFFKTNYVIVLCILLQLLQTE